MNSRTIMAVKIQEWKCLAGVFKKLESREYYQEIKG